MITRRTDSRHEARHFVARRTPAATEEPASGVPLRTANKADPSAVCAPGTDVHALTGRGRLHALGNGDQRSPVDRPGSATAAAFPSRRGSRLYFADGRVTALDGTPIDAPDVPRSSLPDSVGEHERIRRIVDARYGATRQAR